MAIDCYYKSITKFENTKIPDGRGGFKYKWVTLNKFQGLINQSSSKEIEMAKKMGLDSDYKLYCAIDVDLHIDDLLLQNDEYYRVLSKGKNTVGRNHHMKYFLKNISLDKENFNL